MNSKQARTLKAVFADPVTASLEWKAIENLLIAAGCRVIEGSGSRVRFEKDGFVIGFRRPHPAKEVKRHHVLDARKFLIEIGIKP
jgi:hypothetical protein